MPQRVEAFEFYSRVSPEEQKSVEDVVSLILKVVKDQPRWRGVVALVGGRLNKPGKRKDIDIKVIIFDYSYAEAITQAVENGIAGPDRQFAYVKLGNEYNDNIALYLQSPDSMDGTPIHLILPSHGISANNLDSRWPWNRKKKFAILAEF